VDIYCTRCAGAWDMDTLHDVIDERIAAGIFEPLEKPEQYVGPEYDAYAKAYARYYDTVRDDFYTQGCAALTGYSHVTCEPAPEPEDGKLSRAHAMSLLVDVLGDDLDGIASMMDDAEYLGYV